MDRKEKELREQIGEISQKMERIVSKAEKAGRELNQSEIEKFDRLDKQVNEIKRKIKSHQSMIKNKNLQEFGNAPAGQIDVRPGGGANAKDTGGNVLDPGGSVRLYTPGQKLQADHSPESDIDLGSYLRAIVQGPRTAEEREVVQRSVTSDNYELPVSVSAELIDRLRAVNPLLSGAGARTITLEGGETKFVKTDSDPNAVWHAEMVEETPSDPAFSPITMDPKTVLAMTEIGRETLQDSQNVAEALTNAFVGSLNDAILNATFNGAGTADEPEGLQTLITQTAEYANAGTPDWTNFIAASKQLHDNNVPGGNRSFIHAPDVWESLALATDNNGRYQDAPSFIRDIPNFVTSGLNAGNAYAGDFSNVVYGFRLNITLEQFRSTTAKSYGTLWVAAARLDIATFRPDALVRIEEAAV